VDESQIARVSEGARARITGSSLAEPIDARVTRLGAEVYRQKRPNSDILVGRDARIVEVEVTPEKALPRVLGAEVSVEISPRALR
jgi:HlyD family secretion protein